MNAPYRSIKLQKAQLSQRDRARLRVIEYFARLFKSLKVIENGTIRKLGYGFLFAFHSNWPYLVSFQRQSEILVENRDLFTPFPFDAPVRGLRPSKHCHNVWCRKIRVVWLPEVKNV